MKMFLKTENEFLLIATEAPNVRESLAARRIEGIALGTSQVLSRIERV